MPELQELLEQGVLDGTFAGASLHVQDLRTGSPVVEHRAGHVSSEPPGAALRHDTLWDIGSLVKLYTASAALRCIDDLDRPVGPLLGRPHLDRVSVRHLLNHRSGLPAWKPLFTGFDVVGQALASELEGEPGHQHRYSDLGFLVLGEVLRLSTGLGIAALLQREVLGPLGLAQTAFRGTHAQSPIESGDVAATERCAERGLLVGQVLDRNTWALGGAAPHAGLFAPAHEVAALAQAWWEAPQTGWISAERRAEAWGGPAGGHVLGWDTVSPTGYTSAGRSLSSRSIGHLGFTGTSLWIDPERALAIVLLSNRTHPSRSNQRLRAFRPRLHDAVVAWLDRA